ncbi:MAG TPA: type II secretion system F family protein [Nautiliaceae bacterium]|nr:type II secretion system F family protein [Nautiliaceae bacterium]
MYFKIKYSHKGKIQETVLVAKSLKDALNKFKNKKLGVLIDIEKIDKASFTEKFLKKLILSKIDLEEFISILDQMSVMLDAGIAIDLVLENIVDFIKNRKLKAIFRSILQDIKAGLSLNAAFKKHEKELGTLVVAMIKLGEETGDLVGAIKNLSLILNEILDNRKRLKKATRYPMFIVFAMSIAFIIVILFVIPPFKVIFAQLNIELPLPTKFLLWIEGAIKEYGLYILLGMLMVSGILSYIYNKSEAFRLKADKFILNVYIVGDVIKLAMIGRFIYVLHHLIDAGIPILDAVDISLNIVENFYIKKRLETIKHSIIRGGGISKGFKESGLFESMIIQMIVAGEESGSLVLMLQKISNYYLQKYKYIVDNIATLIEPILIAAISGFVITLALGIFLPMWNLIEAM